MFASQRFVTTLFGRTSPLTSTLLKSGTATVGPAAQRGYLSDTRLGASSNNFLVLDDTKGTKAPQLKLSEKLDAIALHGEDSLEQIAKAIQNQGFRVADFFAPDGSRYAKSSQIKEVMRFPFFTLRVDSQNYHIHSSRAFKQSLSVKTPAEKEFYSNSVQNYHLNDLKARTSSKIFALIVERLEKSSPDEMHTPETVSLMLRDGMAKHVLTVNRERESLIQQLDLVRDVLAPLEKEVENAKEAANIKSKRAGLTFVGVIMAQFALSQYGTYVFFSWDIMEPICACVTLSDAIAGYYFWLYSGKPWDLDSLKSFWYERELQRVFKKQKINREDFEHLQASRDQILDRLMEYQ